MAEIKRKACFLDRDGVIIEEKNYLGSPDGVEILASVPEALKFLQEKEYLLIVLSNQSGVARGYFGTKDVDAVNAEISRQLAAQGVSIDAFYYCPHHPEDQCCCRKPQIGMLQQAIKDYDIDLEKSFMIGDKVCDLQMADNAGIRSMMVLTGHGKSQNVDKNTVVAANLLEAVRLLTVN